MRPANLSRHSPGRGLTIVPARDDTPVAVINVMGQLFLDVASGPFEVIDELVDEARAQTKVIFVDMHAEATSEKVALARWLDGRVTAVVRTHTHVQTNDAGDVRIEGALVECDAEGRATRCETIRVSAA